MNYTLIVILGSSVMIPAILAIFRINKIDRIYFPFLICIWLGLLNEVLNFILINEFHVSNSINTNIYCLLEALLYIWLFKNFDLFRHQRIYVLLVSFICLTWLIDHLVISDITTFNSYFTVTYSLVIVGMSIILINRLIVTKYDLLRNPMFLICAGLIIYFSLLALTQIFWLYGLNSSKIFRQNIYRIMACVNLSVNLIFSLAILWMNRKQEFTPLY